MSRTVITLDYDAETDQLYIERENDPEIDEEAAQDHPAAVYGAIAMETLNQAADAQCVRCVGEVVNRLRDMADALHAGKGTVEMQSPDETNLH